MSSSPSSTSGPKPSMPFSEWSTMAGAAPVDEVPVPVGTVRAHEGEVGAERGLEDVLAPAERPPLLALGDQRAGAGRRVEGGDAGAAGPHALGERPLRHQLELDLAC